MVDYGRHSETERVLVSDEGLAILSLLKIQSGPMGNHWDVGRQSLTMLISINSLSKTWGAKSVIPHSQLIQNIKLLKYKI
jgi:hypothetical protein